MDHQLPLLPRGRDHLYPLLSMAHNISLLFPSKADLEYLLQETHKVEVVSLDLCILDALNPEQ